VTLDELTGPTRKREITVPRQMAIFLTREMIGMSLPQIGSLFGGRDHTTVLHSCRAIEANMEKTPSVRRVIEEIKQQVKNAR
jgi:chromosomal replication initiator protein